MSQDAITVKKVYKKFAKGTSHQIKYGLMDTLSLGLGLTRRFDSLRDHEFWALQDVSFSLKKGDTLGIIGSNGSGKSTLLRMVAGVYTPDKGSIRIRGKVGALIELGAGFHPELTGRENIYLNGTLLGLSHLEIKRLYRQIVDFSELKGFMHVPVKNYSSGMYARLGFSIMAHVQPEILLVDEVLSVGDIHFQKKSWEKMKELRRNKCSIVLVAHNMLSVQAMCKKSVWIEKGRVRTQGKTSDVIASYYDYANQLALKDNATVDPSIRKGSGEIRITNVVLLDKTNRPVDAVTSGDPFRVRLFYERTGKIPSTSGLVFGLSIAEPASRELVTIAKTLKHSTSAIKSHGQVDFAFDSLPLSPKSYTLNVNVINETGTRHMYDVWSNAAMFKVNTSSLITRHSLVGDSTLKLPYTSELQAQA